MRVCGQTLVLIDNDATCDPVNQKLVRATLKYMFYHCPEDRAFCLNTYDHDITKTEEYINDQADLACMVDGIEFEPKDSNLCDTICEVITRWKESDFACRDIVVFTDGLEGDSLYHEKEELYYLTEKNEYPVYVVMLDQENNAGAKKGLSAIAVTSGGKLFETEFEGSDAEVDRQLSEKIFGSMQEYAEVNWKKYEETEEEDTDEYIGQEYDDEAERTDEEYTEDEVDSEQYMAEAGTVDRVVYEYDKKPGFFEGSTALILSAALIFGGLFMAFMIALAVAKRRNDKNSPSGVLPEDEEDSYFADYELQDMGSRTICLDGDADDGDQATRLLCGNGRVVTLIDRTRDKTIRIAVDGRMTIGRGNCDVVIADDALSRRHCELYEKGDAIRVRDLSSANGTIVNGMKIADRSLSDGDELTIGTSTYTVRL